MCGVTPDEAVVVRQLLALVVERVHGPGVDDILKRAEDLLSPDPCVVAGVEVRTLTAKQLGIAASDDDSYRSGLARSWAEQRLRAIADNRVAASAGVIVGSLQQFFAEQDAAGESRG